MLEVFEANQRQEYKMTEQLKNFGSWDWVERALWTAVQAFVAVFVVTDLSTLRSAATAGLAALISSVKTVAKDRLKG